MFDAVRLQRKPIAPDRSDAKDHVLPGVMFDSGFSYASGNFPGYVHQGSAKTPSSRLWVMLTAGGCPAYHCLHHGMRIDGINRMLNETWQPGFS